MKREPTPLPLKASSRALLDAVRVPVPHGSETRGWARLDAAIEGPRDRPWRRAAGWAWAPVAAGLMLFLFLRAPPSDVPQLPRLAEGAVHRVHGGESARLAIGDRAQVRLEGPSVLTVSRLNGMGAAELEFEGGAVQSWVQPRVGVGYAVTQGPWRVTALGTVFSVVAREDGGIDVRLSEGRIRVEGPGVDEVLVAPSERSYRLPGEQDPSAHTSTSSARAEAAARRGLGTEANPGPTEPEEATRAEARTNRRRSARRHKARGSGGKKTARARRTPSPEASPARPRVQPDRSPKEAPSESALAESGSEARSENPPPEAAPHDDAPEVLPLDRVEALIEGGALEEARTRLLDHLRSTPSSERTAWLMLRISVGLERSSEVVKHTTGYLERRNPSPERRRELIYWRAESLRRLGRFEAASADFEKIASGQDDRAEDALWSLAWCQAQLGNFARARMLVQDYLSRFPNGRFAGAARAWLER